MKKIVKKNQIIITSLVVMIIVAGYLNFTADKVTPTAATSNKKEKTVESQSSDELADISDEDIQVAAEEDMDDINQQVAEGEEIEDVNSIGEAVLTSTPAAKSFSAAAKLNREQTRSKNQETLMGVINNKEVNETLKENAMNDLLKITETAEKELAVETLLEAKGYNNSVVSINDESVDVVICLDSLSDTQKAQVEDIVMRKAEVNADKVVITTLK